ncbi:hypothetical protein BSU04_23710 [Caballeronia sordidicola]|jgi:hypothetical protein|uniref:Uncharacterized protein n=1 Tax=Caballeronia sordidicola TaxID=196367 RepID=A0A226WZ87_CABSO|nr:hypothetical protein BSU04_23710 [Caballeronia sordidicola]
MNAPTSYIRLPSALSDAPLVVLPPSLDDDEFAAHQVEFIRRVFGYCEFLRAHSRETPVSDAFLAAFVNLFEAMNTNAPEDARRCAKQLQEILRVVFPGLDPNAQSVVAPPELSDIGPASTERIL